MSATTVQTSCSAMNARASGCRSSRGVLERVADPLAGEGLGGGAVVEDLVRRGARPVGGRGGRARQELEESGETVWVEAGALRQLPEDQAELVAS